MDPKLVKLIMNVARSSIQMNAGVDGFVRHDIDTERQ